jgi:hypothetical protein
MSHSPHVEIKCGDVLTFSSDVLALKYAQHLYGADAAVTRKLRSNGVHVNLPQPYSITILNSRGAIAATNVIFVGVEGLHRFDYAQIREFTRAVLVSLSRDLPNARTLSLTIHGPGYGLDEIEAFTAELAGLADAVANGEIPRFLELISFIERNQDRAERLTSVLKSLLPSGVLLTDGKGTIAGLPRGASSIFRTSGYLSAAKAHVFVAMPIVDRGDDIFHYGIRSVVDGMGMICERVERLSFTGDVAEWVKRRIASSCVVIADLSLADPNVYLVVGYAWGREVPTVLLTQNRDTSQFADQRCIVYDTIRSLEETLTRALANIIVAGDIPHDPTTSLLRPSSAMMQQLLRSEISDVSAEVQPMIDLASAAQIATIAGNAVGIVDKIYAQYVSFMSKRAGESGNVRDPSITIQNDSQNQQIVSRDNAGNTYQAVRYSEIMPRLNDSDLSYVRSLETSMSNYQRQWQAVSEDLSLSSGMQRGLLEAQLDTVGKRLGQPLSDILTFFEQRVGLPLDDHYLAARSIASRHLAGGI